MGLARVAITSSRRSTTARDCESFVATIASIRRPRSSSSTIHSSACPSASRSSRPTFKLGRALKSQDRTAGETRIKGTGAHPPSLLDRSERPVDSLPVDHGRRANAGNLCGWLTTIVACVCLNMLRAAQRSERGITRRPPPRPGHQPGPSPGWRPTKITLAGIPP
jgi:hypothetical protein